MNHEPEITDRLLACASLVSLLIVTSRFYSKSRIVWWGEPLRIDGGLHNKDKV